MDFSSVTTSMNNAANTAYQTAGKMASNAVKFAQRPDVQKVGAVALFAVSVAGAAYVAMQMTTPVAPVTSGPCDKIPNYFDGSNHTMATPGPICSGPSNAFVNGLFNGKQFVKESPTSTFDADAPNWLFRALDRYAYGKGLY